MAAVIRVGLTGGIGSGKSTVLQMLVARGAAAVDADAISRSITASGGLAIAAIAREFGDGLITAEGALDRQKMRELAYTDADARKCLEGILHPLIGQEHQRQAQAAVDAGATCIVFDVPLLVESGRWRQQVAQVLVVDCHPDTQIARVMARNALTRETVLQIMAAQATRAQRLAAADVVICNEGAVADLQREVNQIAHRFGL